MGLSKCALKECGFLEIDKDTPIKAIFKITEVFSIQGISFNAISESDLLTLSFQSEEFSFSFGKSVNEICQTHFKEEYITNEEEWMKEKKVVPPYLLINISMKEPTLCTQGYWKKENERIITYDSFQSVREELSKIKATIIPRLISSLVIKLSKTNYPIRLKPIDQKIYGRTDSGDYVFDFRLDMTAGMIVSSNLSLTEMEAEIYDSVQLYKKIDHKVSFHFYSALNEVDRFKQFLSLFLTIEVFTNRQFKSIEDSIFLEEIISIPERIKESGTRFFIDGKNESKNLSQRFIWCSLLRWENVTDLDIEDFKSIKKTRDKISHGEIISESELPNEKLEKLILKIM
jgi:hypothetical protein